MPPIKLKVDFQKGEVATAITIGALLLLGAVSLVSSYLLQKGRLKTKPRAASTSQIYAQEYLGSVEGEKGRPYVYFFTKADNKDIVCFQRLRPRFDVESGPTLVEGSPWDAWEILSGCVSPEEADRRGLWNFGFGASRTKPSLPQQKKGCKALKKVPSYNSVCMSELNRIKSGENKTSRQPPPAKSAPPTSTARPITSENTSKTWVSNGCYKVNVKFRPIKWIKEDPQGNKENTTGFLAWVEVETEDGRGGNAQLWANGRHVAGINALSGGRLVWGPEWTQNWAPGRSVPVAAISGGSTQVVYETDLDSCGAQRRLSVACTLTYTGLGKGTVSGQGCWCEGENCTIPPTSIPTPTPTPKPTSKPLEGEAGRPQKEVGGPKTEATPSPEDSLICKYFNAGYISYPIKPCSTEYECRFDQREIGIVEGRCVRKEGCPSQPCPSGYKCDIQECIPITTPTLTPTPKPPVPTSSIEIREEESGEPTSAPEENFSTPAPPEQSQGSDLSITISTPAPTPTPTPELLLGKNLCIDYGFNGGNVAFENELGCKNAISKEAICVRTDVGKGEKFYIAFRTGGPYSEVCYLHYYGKKVRSFPGVKLIERSARGREEGYSCDYKVVQQCTFKESYQFKVTLIKEISLKGLQTALREVHLRFFSVKSDNQIETYYRCAYDLLSNRQVESKFLILPNKDTKYNKLLDCTKVQVTDNGEGLEFYFNIYWDDLYRFFNRELRLEIVPLLVVKGEYEEEYRYYPLNIWVIPEDLIDKAEFVVDLEYY